MENRCIVCGAIIPEGRQICPNCENGYTPKQERNEELNELRVYMPTFADVKKKIDEMKQAADRLLQITKEFRETISIPWIK